MCGAFPPVDLRAVCFVLVIVQLLMLLFYLCSCVCVFCGLMFGSREKGRKRYDTFTSTTLHMVASIHPHTGTSLHMVVSKSIPERIEVTHQIGIHSVLTSTHGTVLAFPHKLFCSKFDTLSHDWLLAFVCSGGVSSQPPHNILQTLNNQLNQKNTINHGEYDLLA
jgi:hypothetical protein